MKLLKYEHREELFTVDITHVSVDSSMTIDTTVTDVYSHLAIDIVPRIRPSVTSTTVLISHITNEFTKEEYEVPTEIEVLSNSTYRLYLLDTDFVKPESKYSIDIKSSEDTIYKGKVMVTDKEIQNYRYTTINNDKLYI